MNKINGKVLFSLGLVLVLAFLIYVSMGYNPAARLVPLVVLVPGLIAAVLQFGIEVRGAFFPKQAKSDKQEEESAPTLPPREKLRRELVAIGWLLTFFALILLLGQVIAIPLSVFIFTRFFGRESWRLSIFFAVLCWAFAYGLFVYGLRIQLWEGYLPPLLER